jgi:parallel beta-helix repeat protein
MFRPVSRPWAGARLVCLSLLLLAPPLVATEYYVAPPPAGSDGNPGTLAAPWATLQHAADSVGPGDVVTALAGDHAAFEMTSSGSPGAPIVFRAAPGPPVRIVTDVPGRGAGVNVEGAAWIVIEGFTIENRGTVGIRAVLCDQVTIRGNVLRDNGRWGILTGCCDDLLIEGNIASGSCIEHGIYVSNSGDRPVVRGNVVRSNDKNGIHMNGDLSVDCDGATVQDGVITDALVEGNLLFDNGHGDCTGPSGGSAINCDGVQDSTFRNNLIWNTHASGISLYQIDGGGPATGNRVIGNTIHVASDGRWAVNIQDDSTGNTVVGNTLWSEHGTRGAIAACPGCLAGLVSNRNAVEDRFSDDGGDSSFISLATWRTATGQDLQSVVATPAGLYVDPAAGDYHLKPGSAALDLAPVLVDLTRDLEGAPRPQGATSDAGTYEGTGALFRDDYEGGSILRWSTWAP